ncbi:MAG: sulfite exporter TauE/SafE family protein, partial [Peptococcaceae bacterium]
MGSALGLEGKLGAAITKAQAGAGAGQIDANAPRGFLGIPGAPQVNPILAFLWAVWVGWIFSTV